MIGATYQVLVPLLPLAGAEPRDRVLADDGPGARQSRQRTPIGTTGGPIVDRFQLLVAFLSELRIFGLAFFSRWIGVAFGLEFEWEPVELVL